MHLFQSDSYRRELNTRVVAIRADGDVTVVRLEETIFYAESGGQPSDLGAIGGYEVVGAARVSDGIEYRVARRPDSVPIDSGPLEIGPLEMGPLEMEQEVAVSIDWPRRYDLMQQHSAQHLITAIADDRFGWETTSFHLGADYCAIELDVGEMMPRELEALVAACNLAIREARPIESRSVSPQEFDSEAVRSRGLPDDHEGDIRLVSIEGLDLNTCGGTHVASTAELQLVHVPKVEPARGGTRLTYLAGGRALAQLESYAEMATQLSELLSVGPDDFVGQVSKLQDDLKAAAGDARRGWDAWADARARELAQSSEAVVEVELEVARMDLLAKIAAAIPEDRLFFGTAGPPRGEGVFLLQGRAEVVEELGPRLAEALGGRGGGRGGRYQGKGRLSARADALTLLLDSAPD